jgi:hypothetical protein
MCQDPIVTEVRRVRQAHAAEFGYDLNAIYRALKEEEQQGRHQRVSFSPKPVSFTLEQDRLLSHEIL